VDQKIKADVKEPSLKELESWLESADDLPYVMKLPLHSTLYFAKTPLNASLWIVTSILIRNRSAQTQLSHADKRRPPRHGPDAPLFPPVTDCQQLLELTDWSQTCLGPRRTWSPVINVMIDVIMASKTQDALWLGVDFVMI
jgi:hypothetical protein